MWWLHTFPWWYGIVFYPHLPCRAVSLEPSLSSVWWQNSGHMVPVTGLTTCEIGFGKQISKCKFTVIWLHKKTWKKICYILEKCWCFVINSFIYAAVKFLTSETLISQDNECSTYVCLYLPRLPLDEWTELNETLHKHCRGHYEFHHLCSIWKYFIQIPQLYIFVDLMSNLRNE